jgi:3-dehydroquinate synthase
VKRIRVKLRQNGYDVLIGAGLLEHAGRELRRVMPSQSTRIFVVTSPTVRRHWGEKLDSAMKRASLSYSVLEMNDGEPAKRLHAVEQLAEKMVEAGADRKTLMVAFGGGVVGDCAGFLASIFLRGVPVVQIPTTVLAQVDASIGGKTGVNLRAGKNLIGTIHQPRAVLVDPNVLETLDDREFRAGLFESLKCGVIRHRRLFDFMVREADRIREHDRKAIEQVIVDSVQVKAQVVAADERESDLRRILNFGHTIGHALEAATGYTQLLHGEAVAWGMIAAASIGRDAGVCNQKTAEQVQKAVQLYGPLPSPDVKDDDVESHLAADKKTVAGVLHWVLPEKIGKVKVVTGIENAIVRKAIGIIRRTPVV